MTQVTSFIQTPSFNLGFPHAFLSDKASSLSSAKLKQQPEDFYVEEVLGFIPSGEGEHVYLQIKKTNENTPFVANTLASFAGVKSKDVSYAGMKDKRAVTLQWFSIYLPKGDDIDWQSFSSELISVVQQTRHNKKLRRGVHEGNLFKIRLKEFTGDRVLVEENLNKISDQGVPNYFGEQRFGREGKNLHEAAEFLARAKGKQKGFKQRRLVSVARAWLFNQVLSFRVEAGTWNSVLKGDLENIPSAPLWGRGRLESSDELQVIENNIASHYVEWAEFLEHCGLQQERRSCVLKPKNLLWHFDESDEESDLVLSFELSSGEYATTLLREVLTLV